MRQNKMNSKKKKLLYGMKGKEQERKSGVNKKNEEYHVWECK